MLLMQDLHAIKKAYDLIRDGKTDAVDLGHGMHIHKVPTDNPQKYTIQLNMEIDTREV